MNSLRLRLQIVALLAVLAFVSAALSLWGLARSSATLQRDRVESMALSDAMRVLDHADDPFLPHRGRGPRGGIFDAATQRPEAVVPAQLAPLLAEALAEARRTHQPAKRSAEVDRVGFRRGRWSRGGDGPGVVAVAVVPDEGTRFAWGVARVPTQGGPRLWRAGVLFLALASIALVVVSLRTLSRLDEGAGQLTRGLDALTRDLNARVERPRVRELAAVAEGIESMAAAVLGAQRERDALSDELTSRERLAALGRVVTGVAHEVRNPLAAIKLKVDLAAMSLRATEPAVAEDLGTVSDEVSRLDRLVNDLLVISGRRQGARSTIPLDALARSRVALLEPKLAPRGLTATVTGEATVEGDRDGLVRAIDNILRNAAEASPDGGEVRVEVGAAGGVATVRVSDAGAGVPEDRVAELFEPFFTTKAEGTGLGLALSRAVAVSHGGGLRYARDGGRTVFELSLPASRPA
ncbi:MAG: ATP-binding protein [Polyangiales bacterium]